jgi:hypothetical protein
MRFIAKLGLSCSVGVAAIALAGTLPGFQLPPFREYPGVEYSLGEIKLPPDYQEKTEWTFARLMYPQAPGGRYSRGFGSRGAGRRIIRALTAISQRLCAG